MRRKKKQRQLLRQRHRQCQRQRLRLRQWFQRVRLWRVRLHLRQFLWLRRCLWNLPQRLRLLFRKLRLMVRLYRQRFRVLLGLRL